MMDRALKERIIGAAVLVLVVVLVVPVFLDGPPEEGAIVSERVPLPGQADQETRTVVLERDRNSPVPTGENSERTATTPRPQPAPAQAASRPEPAEAKPAPEQVAEEDPELMAAASATGMWDVQYGAYGDQEKAEQIASDLRKQGYSAFQSPVTTASGRLFRVRIGPHKDRNTAESVAAKLRAEGHEVKVMPR